MRLSWKLGRVAGIDLFLHPSALIAWLIMGAASGQGLVAAFPMFVALFASIVLHELGHALMARRYGIGTQDITLYLIGGVARLHRMPRSAGPEILIALAGPAVNVALAAAAAVVLRLGLRLDLPAGFLNFWFEVFGLNAGLLLFNLLPIFPMDGGRVLRAFLSGWLGRARATDVAATIGQALAIVGGVVGVFAGYFTVGILALFVYFVAGRERAQVRAEERQRDFAQHGITDPPAPPTGFRWATGRDGVWRLVPVMGGPPSWTRSWMN